jgi:hypothetical protein
MPRTKTPIISLEEARARFEVWRQNRKGKTPIPNELWSVAVEVARREGMNRAATELRVEWNELKRRMAGPETAQQPESPTFVELVAPRPQSLPDCNIELECRRGKLRIQLKGASPSYVAMLSRELWETA